ncbi:MAG: type II toxin-antitoxin system Phd/YefM family antitoxin [Armatimonadetes bacterium]|nr:type II toxin-antitoxin system Phd/YefM family antitoxin [Armatimonadota bacterium]
MMASSRALRRCAAAPLPRPVAGLEEPAATSGEDGYKDGYQMTERYSIAQARNHLPRLVHHAEEGRLIELTRRGKPVAVIVSMEQYEHLAAHRPSFWDAVQAFRERHGTDGLELSDEDFANLRGRGPGRGVSW